MGCQTPSRTWHLAFKQAFIQWIFITTCRLWSSHAVPATKKRSEIPLFPSPSTCRHQDVTEPWKPVTVKPRGCHTNILGVMTFDVPFWSVPRIAFLGEIPLAALSPEHSDTKALWFLVHVRPFTGEPNHKGLGATHPWPSGFRQKWNFRDRLLSPLF